MRRLNYFIYDFKYKLYKPVIQWFKNIWKFRKELSNFYDWNYDLSLLRKTIELNRNYIRDYGLEVNKTKDLKVSKMTRALYILNVFDKYEFMELAEKELGKQYVYQNLIFESCSDNSDLSVLKDTLTHEEKMLNEEIRQKSREIERTLWKELWQIIEGQDFRFFSNYDEDYDGSGILTWWD
jgi:hypothetical protein